MAVKKVIVDRANRLHQLPPEILSFLPISKQRKILRKSELVDLATFRWPVEHDAPGDRKIDPAPAGERQLKDLREAMAAWLQSVHGIRVNPAKEIFIGGSISQLILSLTMAFLDNGDIAFVPDVGVPLYRKAIAASGGQPATYEISQKDNWQPNLERVSSRLGRVARLLFLNNPHNPTGAVMTHKEMENLVWIAGRENVVVVNDAAYQTIAARTALSLLAVPGGKKVGVEIGSFAYHFGLPRWPFGFVFGNRDVIHGLEETGSLYPAYLPAFFVNRAIEAIGRFPSQDLKNARSRLTQNSGEVAKLLKLLQLERVGYDTVPFVWSRIEHRRRSTSAANLLYRRSRVLVAPGKGFGDSGDGYLRFSLTADPKDYTEAHDRIDKKLRFLKLSEAE